MSVKINVEKRSVFVVSKGQKANKKNVKVKGGRTGGNGNIQLSGSSGKYGWGYGRGGDS